MSSDGTTTDDPVVVGQRQWVMQTLARQLAVIRQLEVEAAAASDPARHAVAWLAVHRHATGRIRMFETSTRRWEGLVHDAVHEYRAALEGLRQQAAAELTMADAAVVGAARQQLGVRVAVIGKGGAGKTLIASTLARTLGARGRRVLAVDLDPNPGLAFGLGMPQTDAGLPREALDRDDDGGWMTMLAPQLGPMEAIERFATPAPDGVRYLGIGKITDPERTEFRRTMGPLFQIVLNVVDPDWDVIGDLEAGGSTPFQGYHFFAERVLLVVGPSWKSGLTARRLQRLLCGVPSLIVANRFSDEPDHPGLEPDVRIPFDAEVIRADRLGLAPIDHCPDGPAVKAIADLADTLTHEEVLV